MCVSGCSLLLQNIKIQRSKVKLLNLFQRSFCHTLTFFNPYILATRCFKLLIFQTISFVKSYCQSLKYQKFKRLGCKGIGDKNVTKKVKNSVPLQKIIVFRFVQFYCSKKERDPLNPQNLRPRVQIRIQ